MTISKAIEILELNLKEDDKKMPPDVKSALNLGISALKRVAHQRQNIPSIPQPLLRGEEIL